MLFGRKKNDGFAQHITEHYFRMLQKDPSTRSGMLGVLYSALSHDPSPGQLQYIGRECAETIRRRDAYFVQDLMRSVYNDPMPADPKQWKRHCTPDGYRALLLCGSVHPNGYFRERCLRLLKGERDVLPFVLLRVNDWVPAIRKTAQEILMSLLCCPGHPLPISEILDAMPFVEHVRRGRRAQGDVHFSMEELDDVLLNYLTSDPDAVLRAPVTQRRLCYRMLLLHPDKPYHQQRLYLIRHERDGAQRSVLVRSFLQCEEITPELLDMFMQDKYWRIRLEAYEYRMKTQGAWEGLETLLLSPSRPIREFAAYYLEQNGFDSLTYCRGNLPESILALCELGKKEDIPLIRPYLETHPRESLIALVRLGAEDSEALIWRYMHAGQAKLAKTAYRLAVLQPRFSPVQLLPEIERQTDPQLRWRLIQILSKVGDWNIMPILIRLVRDHTHVRPDILNMIASRSSFQTSISGALAQEIREALDYAGVLIPEPMREDILFDVERLSSP